MLVEGPVPRKRCDFELFPAHGTGVAVGLADPGPQAFPMEDVKASGVDASLVVSPPWLDSLLSDWKTADAAVQRILEMMCWNRTADDVRITRFVAANADVCVEGIIQGCVKPAHGA